MLCNFYKLIIIFIEILMFCNKLAILQFRHYYCSHIRNSIPPRQPKMLNQFHNNMACFFLITSHITLILCIAPVVNRSTFLKLKLIITNIQKICFSSISNIFYTFLRFSNSSLFYTCSTSWHSCVSHFAHLLVFSP